MQDMHDQNIVYGYGQRERTFGGMYFDGDILIAMFTGDLDLHTDRLLPLLTSPHQFRVEPAARPYADVEAANGRVQWKLLLREPSHPRVVGVGIGLHAGQFQIHVTVEALTDEIAGELRALAAPDEIVLESGGRPSRL